jgi:hypothetical protein
LDNPDGRPVLHNSGRAVVEGSGPGNYRVSASTEGAALFACHVDPPVDCL